MEKMKNKVSEYIGTLKERVLFIKDNLPENWMDEHLREIQVLYRTIKDLKKISGEESNDIEMERIKNWLEQEWWRSVWNGK